MFKVDKRGYSARKRGVEAQYDIRSRTNHQTLQENALKMRRSTSNESRLALVVSDEDLVLESFKGRILRRNHSLPDLQDVKKFYTLGYGKALELETQDMIERTKKKQQVHM